jgi:hypothetical protein
VQWLATGLSKISVNGHRALDCSMLWNTRHVIISEVAECKTTPRLQFSTQIAAVPINSCVVFSNLFVKNKLSELESVK